MGTHARTRPARRRISRSAAVSALGCALTIAIAALVSGTSHARCGVLVQPVTAVAVQTRVSGAALTEITLHTTALVHPGILVDRGQLEVIKARLAARAEPWTGALAALEASPFASPSYRPRPRAEIECSAATDRGCSDEQNDAIAAYSHAVLWFFTGDQRHADKAIEIMNAWSAVVVRHTGSRASLQAAWAGAMFPRAAEIIRYTYDGWPRDQIAAFRAMLTSAYLPLIDRDRDAPSVSHAELSTVEAAMAIAVFLDDPAAFHAAVARWRTRVSAYITVDGQSQDTCRDLGRVQLGLAALTNAAETARIQGVDLFHEQAARLARSYELHASLLNGADVPRWLCRGKLNDAVPDPTWEIGYAALAHRAGLALPETQRLLTRIRPTGASHHVAWETLTHASIARAEM